MASKVPLASVSSALCEVLQGLPGLGAPGAQAPLPSLWSAPAAAPPAAAAPPRATVLCFLRRLG
jgi:hypothetical protein